MSSTFSLQTSRSKHYVAARALPLALEMTLMVVPEFWETRMECSRAVARTKFLVWAATAGVVLGAQVVTSRPCSALQCQDVRTGRDFYLPAAQFSVSGLELTDQTPFRGPCLGSVRGAHAAPVTDGAGGAFIVWIESAGEDCDLRLQHIDADGNPSQGFPEGGKVLCSAPGTQTQPSIAAATDGSVWAAWKDYRDPAQSAVFIMRLDAAGEPSTGYVPSGTRISDANVSASDPAPGRAPRA